MPKDDEQGRSQGASSADKRQKEEHGKQQSNAERAARMGGGSLSTEDRVVREPVAMREPPEQVVSYQTSHLPAPMPEYRFASGGDVVKEQRGEQKGEREEQAGQEQGQQKDGGKQNGDTHEREQRNEKNQEDNRQENNRREDKQRDRRGDDREEHRERPRKKKHKHHTSPNQPSWKTVLMSGVLALVCGIGGAWGYSSLFGESKSDKQDKSSAKSDKSDQGGKSGGKGGDKSGGDKKQGSSSSQGGASASEIPGFNSAKDADTFKKELEHLAHRLDLLGGRIDRLTTNKDQTPPVFHTLQRKIADMESELDQVANLPSKLDEIQRSFADLRQEFKSLKERARGTELPLASDLSPPSTETETDTLAPPVADPADEATLKLATGLLREGHYSQSYEVFRRLQRERPGDARVWYLSALAYGLSSGKWDGRAKQLAQHGVECERAGHPSSSQVDAAITGLSTPKAKTWLAEQRRGVTAR